MIEIKIKDENYNLMLYLMQSQPFLESIHRMTITSPNYREEGIRGYVAVDVEFIVKDLFEFSNEFQLVYKRWKKW